MSREKALKVVVAQCVRMGTFGGKNHEVCDVDDTDAEGWDELAKESGGCDNFKGDLDADANQDADEEESESISSDHQVDVHIRVFAVVHTGKLPNGRAGDTMLHVKSALQYIWLK